jgi:glycosyltransferase involved in cell wall biosynthesis
MRRGFSLCEKTKFFANSTNKYLNGFRPVLRRRFPVVLLVNRTEILHVFEAYARRDGFKKSTGEYVTFLDSDDFLHKDNIENLLQAIQETNADIAMCEMIEFTGSNRPKPIMSNTKEIIDSKEEAFRLLINNPHKDKFWSMTVWGKLYSKEIVESINWKESNYRVYEDNFWTPQAFDLAKRIVVLRKQLIYYRRYDDDSKPLSKQLTDNNLNGKPVGYLEFDWLWFDFYKSYIKRNNLKLYKDLYEKDYDRFIWRTKRLIEAGVLQAENNEEYIIKICKRHRKWFQNTTEKKDKIIHKQRELINAQNNEIMKIRSLKGATRNLAGAILRKSGIRRKVKK